MISYLSLQAQDEVIKYWVSGETRVSLRPQNLEWAANDRLMFFVTGVDIMTMILLALAFSRIKKEISSETFTFTDHYAF